MLAGLQSIGGFLMGGSAGSFGVDISADTISKTGSTTGPSKTLTTGSVFVTPHGGSGSYSYAWTLDYGSGITATNPTSSATNFTGTLNANDYFAAGFECIVTDTVTGAVGSAFVNVDISLVGP